MSRRLGGSGAGLRRALADDSGAAALAFALAAPMLLGMASLAIDVSRLYSLEAQLQTAADAAAVAGARALPDNSTAVSAAIDFAERNMGSAKHGNILRQADVERGYWDKNERRFRRAGEPPPPYNAVRVVTRRSATNNNPVNYILASTIGFTSGDVAAEAVAVVRGVPVTILSREPGQITLDNGAEVDLGTAAIAANDDAADAFRLESGSKLTANSIVTPGAVDKSGGSQINASIRSGPDVQPVADPYAGLSVDIPPSCGSKDDPDFAPWPAGRTKEPGCYENARVQGKNQTLEAGTYYIDGDLEFDNGSEVSGDGVTFVLLNGEVEFGNGSKQDLSAPKEKTSNDANLNYQGIVMFALGRGQIEWNSGSKTNLNGALYFPERDVTVSGGSKVSNQCQQLVAEDVTFESGSQWQTNCDDVSVRRISAGSHIALVK